MKTKSSLVRILWSLVYLFLAGVILHVASRPRMSLLSALPQQDRTVTRKPWSVEPVKVVAARNKKKEKIEIGKAFDDDDDWLDGFTVTVVNNSDKTVTAMNIEMVFRRDPGDTRLPLAWPLNFGRDPFSPEYLHRDPNKIIKVGETADLHLTAENYSYLKRALQQTGFPVNILRVELVIREVGFEDGSALNSGTLFVQDPNNPNDPTKKIPVSQPTPSRNRKISDPSRPGRRLSQHTLAKTSLASRSVQELCFTQSSPQFQPCSSHDACGVYWDRLSNTEGYYDIEMQEVPCQYSASSPCTYTCGSPPQECIAIDAAQRFVECCHTLQCDDPKAVARDSCSGCPEDYVESGNCCYAACDYEGGLYYGGGDIDCSLCADGIDNDCNGFTDLNDGSCGLCNPSPIVIDTLGDGFNLTSAADGVWFDIQATGHPMRIAWIQGDDAWLALDRNGNGLIDNGRELFGNFTFQPSLTTAMVSGRWLNSTNRRMAATVMG